jgi:hypothetical protein
MKKMKFELLEQFLGECGYLPMVEELLKREGLKRQVNRAQTLEMVGHLCDMMYQSLDAVVIPMWLNGLERANPKKPVKLKAKRRK